MPHHKDARLSFYGRTAVFHFHIDNVAQLSALAANSLCCISCCPKLTISLVLLSVSLLIVNVIFLKKILIRVIIKIYIFFITSRCTSFTNPFSYNLYIYCKLNHTPSYM